MFKFAKVQEQSFDVIKSTQSGSFKRFIASPLNVIASLVLIFVVLGALFIPLFSADPMELNPSERHQGIGQNGHILGTDLNGRDLWSRLWSGMRLSLLIGLMVTLGDVFLGVVAGILMSYFKSVDRVLGAYMKIMSSIPSQLIVLMIAIALKPSVFSITLGLVVTGWISMARMVRGTALSLKHRDFVKASVSMATPTHKILMSFLKHILPVMLTQLIFTIAGALTADAALGSIGLKIIGRPSLGSVLADVQAFMTVFPFEMVGPLSMVFTVIASISIINNGITNAQRRKR